MPTIDLGLESDHRVDIGGRDRHQHARPFRVGILSTYPPTHCGLATFSMALATHLERAGAEVGIVRIVDSPQPPAPRVVSQLVTSAPGATEVAAGSLNSFDFCVVQHEYGIFGGRDGADVLDLLARLRVPAAVVLHTVLTTPTPGQRDVLARVVDAAAVVITMTETARRRLVQGWGVDPRDVIVIPHGAEENPSVPSSSSRMPRSVLTWGLLSPGKGIEWAIRAMAELGDVSPSPVYDIVGQTHPKVRAEHGEAYRDELTALARDLGVESRVRFHDRYLDSVALRQIVRRADVVLLPYDSLEQVTSGVLTEAVMAGQPVVATRFPHAVDLLSDGAGILVPHRDPAAIAAALRRVMTEPGLAQRMAAQSRDLAPSLSWSGVARRYLELGRSLTRRAVTRSSVA